MQGSVPEIESTGVSVVNLDLLTYTGNPANLDSLRADPRHLLVQGAIYGFSASLLKSVVAVLEAGSREAGSRPRSGGAALHDGSFENGRQIWQNQLGLEMTIRGGAEVYRDRAEVERPQIAGQQRWLQ